MENMTQKMQIFLKYLYDFQTEDGSVEIATYPTFEVVYNADYTTTEVAKTCRYI